MHPADPRAYLSQGCEKRLHFLRIPHDHRKRHSANFLYSAERFWLRASPRTSPPYRRAPSLRKPFQEVPSMNPSRRSFPQPVPPPPPLLPPSPSPLFALPTS